MTNAVVPYFRYVHSCNMQKQIKNINNYMKYFIVRRFTHKVIHTYRTEQ